MQLLDYRRELSLCLTSQRFGRDDTLIENLPKIRRRAYPRSASQREFPQRNRVYPDSSDFPDVEGRDHSLE